MFNMHKQHARTIITHFFLNTQYFKHTIIYGGPHLGKHARDTLPAFHAILQNFAQNFHFALSKLPVQVLKDFLK